MMRRIGWRGKKQKKKNWKEAKYMPMKINYHIISHDCPFKLHVYLHIIRVICKCRRGHFQLRLVLNATIWTTFSILVLKIN